MTMATEPTTIPQSTIGVPRRWLESAQPQQPADRVWTRRRKIGLTVALMQLLVGFIAGLLYWLVPAPTTHFVPLWITEYKSKHIPVNFLAGPDRDALVWRDYFPRQSEGAFGSQERHLLMQELASLAQLRGADSVVLYLCAYASGGREND